MAFQRIPAAFQTDAFQLVRAPVEIEAAPFGPGSWIDLTPDLVRPISATWGINGAGPLDLVASSGHMTFALNNSERNSAGKLGYYSPENANCRSGFKLGIPVRLRFFENGATTYKFYGWLDSIEPVAGKRGIRQTLCTATDFMNEAARYKPTGLATQVGLRSDQVMAALIAMVPRQPAGGTSYQVGDSTFPFAFDSSQSESQPVLTEIQRVTQSEYGRSYVRGDGVFYFEKRTARLSPMIIASFDDTMLRLSSTQDRSQLLNRVKATLHPRRVDGVNTTVLVSSQSSMPVAAGATVKFVSRYTDPNNRAVRVGGKDMIAPVATTDYLMNSASDGSGTNLTANFTVVAVYGANSVEYTISNGGAAGFITKLQARGRGLYDYDPFDAVRLDQSSIDTYGEIQLPLDMPYQSDSSVGESVGDYIVSTWSSPGSITMGMGIIATTPSARQTLLQMEPGVAISVRETVTGIFRTYFVHQVSLRLESNSYLLCDLLLQRAQIQTYWTLGTAGKSELGSTTVLAPL
jgi:hypothetical protein